MPHRQGSHRKVARIAAAFTGLSLLAIYVAWHSPGSLRSGSSTEVGVVLWGSLAFLSLLLGLVIVLGWMWLGIPLGATGPLEYTPVG